MNESDLYRELGKLTKDRKRWETSIPQVVSLLTHESTVKGRVLYDFEWYVVNKVPLPPFRSEFAGYMVEGLLSATGRYDCV